MHFFRRPLASILTVVLSAIATFSSFRAATAGGGPENVFLVVNPRSASSLAIANHFIQLRQIPASNVFYLPWEGSMDEIDVETFRQQFLVPITKAVEAAGLGEQIDYIVYSSDFPYRVNFIEDVPPAQKKVGNLSGSITGMTFLAQPVMLRNPAYVNLASNSYFRPQVGEDKTTTSQAFRSWYGWSKDGALLETGGNRYLLSTMLGVTSGRGNSTPEVVQYLQGAAFADGKKPRGTIYYMRNKDVRSTTREPAMAAAVQELKALGVNATIDDGTIPMRKKDVAGAMLGIADFKWEGSGSTILPGAICEHLTSYGGMLQKSAGQTPLTELLRHGAAGASGTVTEPFAIQAKFPLATIHVHYARGCSLAESFYQSVAGPYQLLIVGDPLCAPWAAVPDVLAKGIEAGGKISGKVSITPYAMDDAMGKYDRFELFVNGFRTARCVAGETLDFDSTQYSDGHCELRVVAVQNSTIETQGRKVVPVVIDNHGRSMSFSAQAIGEARATKQLKLVGKAAGAAGIAFYHNGRLLEKVAGEEATVTIPAAALGAGPVRLTAIGWGRGATASDHVVAEPIDLKIELGQ